MAAGDTQRIGHLLLGKLQLVRQLLGRRGALVLLLETGESLVDLIERAHLIERQAHDTRLLGQSLQDRLTNPPHGIRNELETPGFVELLRSLDKTEVSLVDQVGQTEALILILLGHRHDETQIGFGELLQCLLVTLLDSLGKFHLLLNRNELLLADFLQVLVQRRALTVGDGLRNF